MTEQQQHLNDLLQKREILQKELEGLQVQMNSKRELFLKVQGIIEYLTQIGVTPPEQPKQETPEEVSPES